METREAVNRGDRSRAEEGSRRAKKFGCITLAVGLVFCVLSVVLTGIYVWFVLSHALNEHEEYGGFD